MPCPQCHGYGVFASPDSCASCGEEQEPPNPEAEPQAHTLLAKAEAAAEAASLMLPHASESDIEDQALALMYMPADHLEATLQRLVASRVEVPS